MAAKDIRDAKFYVVDETEGVSVDGNVMPLEFDNALQQARSLAEHGHDVRVLYTDEASQMQLTQLTSLGIPTGLAPQG
jgi:hypothetical protein